MAKRVKRRKHKVLVVEDNTGLSEVMRTLLESEGYEVLEAVDGAAAVKIAQVELPEVILMDLQLPVMSGLEATRRIRAISELANTPIVAVTGFATEFDAVRARATGCDEYITKPYKFDELLDTVRRLLK